MLLKKRVAEPPEFRSWLEYLLSRNVLFVFLIKSINFVRVTFRVWQSLTSEQK